MTRLGKFVGVLAVLAVLAMPAAALASCWTAVTMSAGCPLCAGISHDPSQLSIQGAPAGTSCCDVSSSKPAPASELQLPATTTVLAPPSNGAIAVSVSSATRVDTSTWDFTSPPVSPQAVLCTFLI